MRRDVLALAKKLSAQSGMSDGNIYDWLMDVGRGKKINPCKLKYVADIGVVWVEGEHDTNRLEKYLPEQFIYTREGSVPRDIGIVSDPAYTDFWENKILARQEKYMD